MTAHDIAALVLLGHPVQHSISPAFQNAALRAAGIPLTYDALDVEPGALGDRVRALVAQRAAGNVTIPHKAAVAEMCDMLTPVAQRAGAVNTFWVQQGALAGDNTDVAGFDHLARRVLGSIPLGARVAVLGAGGSARAVAVALSSSNSQVTIYGRNAAKAHDVAMTSSSAWGTMPPPPGSWDLLVNCTPVGMYPKVDETPLEASHLTGAHVYDLIYNPTTTRLMREAAKKGLQAIGGLEMLVAQACEQFEWWTGTKPPAGVMREAALKRLAEFMRQ